MTKETSMNDELEKCLQEMNTQLTNIQTDINEMRQKIFQYLTKSVAESRKLENHKALTNRESEVIALVAEGLSNGDVARHFWIREEVKEAIMNQARLAINYAGWKRRLQVAGVVPPGVAPRDYAEAGLDRGIMDYVNQLP